MLNWENIDTVMLDMDGTLPDLHYDHYFWVTHFPKRYAEIKGLSLQQAALEANIGHLLVISEPDSRKPPQDTKHFISAANLGEAVPNMPTPKATSLPSPKNYTKQP